MIPFVAVALANGDVWRARRSSPTEPFGAAQNVAEVNTDGTEFPTWISPDDCQLLVGVDESTGDQLLYRAVRPP
jgi:hypothetical protein